jgi:hypothetical protein
MISLPQYKVLGGDGQEYGPVYVEQICTWIEEGRLEKKSPVKPPEAKDWVFLGDLPEFTEAFKWFETPEHIRQREARWRVAIVLLALTGMVLLVLIRLIHHHHHH